ncbi:SDR family NAD(P)-dependent oxidoreductase [Dactylosporangium sucinum]|uniref:Short-chain type dehydrogenase/reductase y4lA n=1 Tax=Dactylosporangium sucinum TaxID=1424081 RepID=A0A917UDJ5_9ACTN|nr:SDR family oxidoreductase [Dactylosporangium sucinum]GGM78218.1 putative short-chain type dehydrogenase/reductase y4lA [Dactylosporangium sucinum]
MSELPAGRFAGRVAVVTGAAGGAGRACAARLARDGARVVIADIDGPRAAATAAEITAEVTAATAGSTAATAAGSTAATGGGAGETIAVAVTADVSDEASVAAMVAAAVDAFGGLDILVNNAAALQPELHRRDGDLVALDLDVWERTMAVNAGGTYLACKHAVPAMRARGGGAIVNVASVSALVGDDVRAAYGSSKAAVLALTRYVATMYGRDGIRCNAVTPGLILTGTALAALSGHHLDEFAAERLLPWAAGPADIAAVVAWLAGDESRCITGQSIVVDAGTTAHRPLHAMRSWSDQHAKTGE